MCRGFLNGIYTILSSLHQRQIQPLLHFPFGNRHGLSGVGVGVAVGSTVGCGEGSIDGSGVGLGCSPTTVTLTGV